MPTYVYECKSCNGRFEVKQPVSDPPLTTCESCSGELRRVFFPSRVIFKGSGWHITDYKKNGGKDKEAGEGESKAAGDSKAEGTVTPAETKKD